MNLDFGSRSREPEFCEIVEPSIEWSRPVDITSDRWEGSEIGLDTYEVPQELNSKSELLEVWVDEESFLLDDGEYFRRGSEGLVWVPIPVGALVHLLPIGANTIWHEEREFLEFDGGFFKRSPSGFRVVNPPWVEVRNARDGEELEVED